ncbi:hypothetical protein UFOVP59_19 [uncultured Caudovirales phage]|uniref:Uncharacterized protein n=1 Tax=uncultured Caudovirales phage TaxID=2100421 RepID=A0A6J5KQ46_9CAUD|nr:hypothetical protein UFOVP59_19 [uncultured Caudovirales phage]CAB5220606.1 hypothetical protein UFOVP246_13 [uncultured Caudovirales phage]
MSETIKIFGIKKPDGTFWKSPNGKVSWSSTGAAKNSWNCHSWFQEEYTNTAGNKHFRWKNKQWKVDAEPNGWSVVKLKEFKLVDDTENE